MTTKKQKTIVQKLIVKAPTRKSYDVGNWRMALKSADIGRVKLLFDLYDDLLIDGLLSDAFDKRTLAVVNSALTFQDANGKEVEEITSVIDSPDFEELLKTIMQRIFWGRSGGEFNFDSEEGFAFEPFPAKHINLDTKSILLNDTDSAGIPYEGDDHLLILGKPKQFGLMLKTAPYAIYKRGGFGDYAQWLELFGMPQRVGKYSSYDPESRKLLEQALEQAGSAPWVVIPKDSEVETTNQGSNNNGGNSYNDFRRACNEEILITVLGQTLTTVQNETGARSLGEVHKEVEEGKNKADMRYVQRVLNFVVLPLLEKRGFPVSGGSFVFPESAIELTVTDLVQLSNIMDIPQSFLHEKFSIPVPQQGEPVAKNMAGAFSSPSQEEVDAAGGQGAIENTDRNAWERVLSFFAEAPHSGALNGAARINLNDNTLTDRIITHAIRQGGFMPELFEWISADLIAALTEKSQNLSDLGFRYGYQSDAFRTAQELNVFQFSAAKALAESQRLNELYRETKTFDEFYKAATAEVDVFNKTWQRTEHQTATLISESSETYNRLNAKKDLFKFWVYTTVGDSQVRAEHAALNGATLPANDPAWDKIYPPNGWKCRCYVVPRMQHEVSEEILKKSRAKLGDFYDTKEWKTAKASGFGVNRAASPEIFNANQQYIAKFPDKASTWLKDINYRDYGLKSFEQYRKAAPTKMPVFNGNPTEFVNRLIKEDGKTFLTDYNERKILFDYKSWAAKHTKKAAERKPLLDAVAQSVKSPDEVWINANQKTYRIIEKEMGAKRKTKLNPFSQYVFLKYYQDETIAVVANISGTNIYEVATWFSMAENAATMAKFRSGLLIKKPSL